MTSVQLLTTVLRLESTHYSQGMARAVVATKAFERSLHAAGGSVGLSMERASRGAQGLAVITGAFGAAAIKASIDFESAFTGVVKTVEGTSEQLDVLRTGILNMSEEIPESANGIAAVAEQAGQLGIARQNVLEFTRTMIDLGESTNLTSVDAAKALARFVNIMGTSQTQFDNLGSAIVDLGNNFATTESEITDIALRLAGAGKIIGANEADVLGFSTAMSSIGIAAERAGTAMTRTFVDINSAVDNGGEKMEGFAKVAGVTVDEFARQWRENPTEAVLQFIEGLDALGDAGGNVSGTLDELGLRGVRVQQTLIGLAEAGDLTRRAVVDSNIAFKENTALAVESERRYATAESELRRFGNTLKRELIDTGTEQLPRLLEILNRHADTLPRVLNDLATAGLNLFESLSNGLPILEGIALVMAKIPAPLVSLGLTMGIAARATRTFLLPLEQLALTMSGQRQKIQGNTSAWSVVQRQLDDAAESANLFAAKQGAALSKAQADLGKSEAAYAKHAAAVDAAAIKEQQALERLTIARAKAEGIEPGYSGRTLEGARTTGEGKVLLADGDEISPAVAAAIKAETDAYKALEAARLNYSNTVKAAATSETAVEQAQLGVKKAALDARKASIALTTAEINAIGPYKVQVQDLSVVQRAQAAHVEEFGNNITKYRRLSNGAVQGFSELSQSWTFVGKAQGQAGMALKGVTDDAQGLINTAQNGTGRVARFSRALSGLSFGAVALGLTAAVIAFAQISKGAQAAGDAMRDLKASGSQLADTIGQDVATGVEPLQNLTKSILEDYVKLENEIRIGPGTKDTFPGNLAFDQRGLDSTGKALTLPINLAVSTLTPIDTLEDVGKAVSALSGEYALSDEVIDKAGLSTREFIRSLTDSGEAAKGVGADLQASSGFFGRWSDNASEAWEEVRETFREDLGEVFGQQVENITTSALAVDQYAEAQTGATVSTYKAALALEDLDYEKFAADVAEATAQITTLGQAFPDLDVDENLASLVRGISFDVDTGQLDTDKLTGLVFGLRAAGVDQGNVLSQAALAQSEALLAASSNHEEAGQKIIDLVKRANEVEGFTLVDFNEGLQEVDPQAYEAMQVLEAYGTELSIASEAGNALVTDLDTEELVAKWQRAVDVAEEVKKAMFDAKTEINGLDLTGSGFQRLASDLSDADEAAGNLTFEGLDEWSQLVLETGFLKGNYDLAAEAVNKLGLNQEQVVDIGGALVARAQEVAQAFGSITDTSPAGAISVLNEEAQTAYDRDRAAFEANEDARRDAYDQSQDAARRSFDARIDAEAAAWDDEQDRQAQTFREGEAAKAKYHRDYVKETFDRESFDRPKFDFPEFEGGEFTKEVEDYQDYSFSSLARVQQEQTRKKAEFAGVIQRLIDDDKDNVAEALIQLGQADEELAYGLAAKIAQGGTDVVEEFERDLEGVEAANRGVDALIQTQADRLADTDNTLLDTIRSNHGEISEEIKALWGSASDAVIAALQEVEQAQRDELPTEEELALDRLLTTYGEDLVTLDAKVKTDPEELDRSLREAILQLDGYTPERASAFLDTGDLDAQRIALSRALSRIGTFSLTDLHAVAELSKDQPIDNLDEFDAELGRVIQEEVYKNDPIELGVPVSLRELDIEGGFEKFNLLFDQLIPGFDKEQTDRFLRDTGLAATSPLVDRLSESEIRTILGNEGYGEEEINYLLRPNNPKSEAELESTLQSIADRIREERNIIDIAFTRDQAGLDEQLTEIKGQVESTEAILTITPYLTPENRRLLTDLLQVPPPPPPKQWGDDNRESGLFPAGGGVVDYFAGGGVLGKDLPHAAHIAPAGTWRVFAEPETGGEGYIPLAASKRKRSEEILDLIARRFGGQYLRPGQNVPQPKWKSYAQGGIYGQPVRPAAWVTQDRSVSHRTVTVHQQPQFLGDMVMTDPRAAVEYADRQNRKNALVGLA